MVRRSSRQRLLGLTILVGGSGLATGLAAASGLGPFAASQSANTPPRLASVPPQAVRGDTLFPPPTPGPATVRVIQVNDPAPVARTRPVEVVPATPPAAHDDAPRPPIGAPTPASITPQPTPTPTMTSSPTPCHDDGCGGGDG
jgi:hypothetical protein